MKKLYIVFDQIPSLKSGGLIVTYLNMVRCLRSEYDIRIISVFKSDNEDLFEGIPIYNLSEYLIDNRFFRILQYWKKKDLPAVLKAVKSAFYFFAFIPFAKKKMKKMISQEDIVVSVSPTASMFIHPAIPFVQDIHTNFEYFWGKNKFGVLQAKLMSTPRITVFRNKLDAEKGAQRFPSTYLYNFVEQIDYNADTYDIEARKHKILYMGRLHQQKDPMRLLDCAKMLKERGYQFQLDIYGTGALKEDLQRKIISENLTDVASLKGYIKDKKIYSEYSMLWLTSKNEGFGLCIVEAKANATPTISVNWGGAINEVMKHGEDGFIAENNEEFVAYTAQLLENDALLTEMSRNAYRNYCENFSNETVKKRLIHILEDEQR